jgi:hypothetical protein
VEDAASTARRSMTSFLRHSRRLRWGLIGPVLLILILVIVRAALPWAIMSYVNRTLDKIPDYDGQIGDIDLNLLRGAYQIEDVNLLKSTGRVNEPFFRAANVDLSIQWRELLHGSLVGEAVLTQPEINFVSGETKKTSQTSVDASFMDRIQELFPVKINRVEVRDGSIHFKKPNGTPPIDIFIDEIELLATNLTNSARLNQELQASLTARGRPMKKGLLEIGLKMNPFRDEPTFDLNVELEDMDLTSVNNFFRHYAKVDVEKGSLDLYVEAAAENGKFTGYVKPLLRDVDVMDLKKEKLTLSQKVKELFGETFAAVFENKSKDQVATRIPFSGRFDNPRVGMLAAIGQLLRNMFGDALRPTLEDSVGIESVE